MQTQSSFLDLRSHPWLAWLLFALCPPGAIAATNLLPNPSFEEARGEAPREWRRDRWGGEAHYLYPALGRTGERAVGLASSTGADAAWATWAQIEPFARYRLAGWIKTENVVAGTGRGALLNVHALPGAATRALTGSADWTRVEVEFDVEDTTLVQINCLLGGWGVSTGRAWFDDLSLELVERRTPPEPRIRIDAGQLREPLSPLIYSQFIEHLGRCIYGGIWAEMLEDRKFFHPITPTYAPYTALRETAFPVVGASPWEIIGAPDTVHMTTNQPFVGRHTPLIRAPGGIRQHDLGVTAGRAYVGYIWARAQNHRTAEIEVSLVWGTNPDQRRTTRLRAGSSRYRKLSFRFTAGATTDKATLEVRVTRGAALVGTLSLMPADHVDGMRADTLALLRQLNAPLYRWPGGNFVSGYDWRDGIGERDRRPPRTNPAWTGVEHNDFGLHEFIRFCRLVGAEPCITVNTGFGDAHSAAALVEYCNGDRRTDQGRRRAAHGAPQPFGVKYWCVGNEMWGRWQLGYMQLEHYVLKHNWVVEKMRAADPHIVCIASGNIGDWSAGLLRSCADHMDAIAEHFYCGERPGLVGHVRQMNENIRQKADWHRKARRDMPHLQTRDIRVAMTEWNYWYGPQVFGELGTRYFLKDALGIAAGLHEYARHTDIIASAFYAQTVNVIGAIKTSRRHAALETTGLVLKLYRHHFGTLPVNTTSEGLLDAQAAWSADKKRLTLGVVNLTGAPVRVPCEVRGARLRGNGRAWRIAHTDPLACNDPEPPPRVVIEEIPRVTAGSELELPAHSVTLFSWEAEPEPVR